jgi:hypothetical protein
MLMNDIRLKFIQDPEHGPLRSWSDREGDVEVRRKLGLG